MRLSNIALAALSIRFAVSAPVDLEYTHLDKRDFNLNLFLAAIVKTFPVNIPVNGFCSALGIGEIALAAAFDLDINENMRGCADVTIVYARGTCDPGNVGVLVGPPFLNAVKKAIGSSRSVAVQGVEYPASVAGYLSADRAAGVTMAKIVGDTLAKCPNTKFVLGGYSQGGYAVHNAAEILDAATMSRVKAVVVFGDPMSKKPVQDIDPSRVKIICHQGDNICDAGPIVTLHHITYAEDANAAAAFVVSKL